MKKFYLTTPIYYASGKPHIGHAFTTLYADVIARYQRTEEKKVFFGTGLDEHGSKIEKAAKLEKKEPQKFVNELAKYYIKTWKILEIKYDDFIRTTSKRHQKGTLEFIKRLYQKGDIYPHFYQGFYCVDCENFLQERNLINGLCPEHLKKPQQIREKNYFFNLKKYLPIIKEKILKNKIRIIPETRRNEILNIIDGDLSNFSITREKVKWGIPFPYEKNQTIYVWVEALMNYLTILDFPEGEKYKEFWSPDLHIIGTEINKFHSIFWPALLLAVKLPLPKVIFIHGLFTINGQKMSKTLGNTIDPLDLVKRFSVDATRYLLLSQFSALEHGDIKESEFLKKYNSDLANGIGNLFERIFSMIINYRKGKIKKNLSLDKKIIVLAKSTETNYRQNMKNYLLFEALKEIFLFIKNLDRYINEKQPWNLYKKQDSELDKILFTLFWSIEKIGFWLKPFIPSSIRKVENYIFQMKKGKLKNRDKLNLFPRIRK